MDYALTLHTPRILQLRQTQASKGGAMRRKALVVGWTVVQTGLIIKGYLLLFLAAVILAGLFGCAFAEVVQKVAELT